MLLFLSIIENVETKSKLEQIYSNYKKDAYWTSYNILKDHHEAEDVLQDAIIKLSLIIDNIDEIKCNKTRGLFVIIVRNLSFNIYNRRKNKEYTSYEEVEIVSQDLSLDEEMIRLDQTKLMAEKLEKINPSYADILTLKFYYEYSNLEISKLLNITDGNVRTRLHRAKSAIKEILLKEVDYGEFS